MPVKLAAEIPSFVEGQSFSFGSGCYMDTLDGQLWENQVLAVKDQKSIRINGWAVDDESKMLPEATYLRLENSSGRRFYAATIPEDRPDVASISGRLRSSNPVIGRSCPPRICRRESMRR
ncbi:MAG: hypothetical protein IPI44_23975 [Sulfuritalea sp.]|nr:hypothetical protein [Sulfuritalea sp.]